jgi:SPP1 gp7 family putative phage head morphogenesis protein
MLAGSVDGYDAFDDGINELDLSGSVIEMSRVLVSGLINTALVGYVQIERERLGEGKEFDDWAGSVWYLEFADDADSGPGDPYDFRETVGKLRKRWKKIFGEGSAVMFDKDFKLTGHTKELNPDQPEWVAGPVKYRDDSENYTKVKGIVSMLEDLVSSYEDHELSRPGFHKLRQSYTLPAKLVLEDEGRVEYEDVMALSDDDKPVMRKAHGYFNPLTGKVHIAADPNQSPIFGRGYKSKYNRNARGPDEVWTVDESVYGTLSHELSHHLYHGMGNGTASVWRKINENLPKDKKIISGYGDQSVYDGLRSETELWAECFAAYQHPDYKPGTLPPAIEEFAAEVAQHGGIISDEQIVRRDQLSFASKSSRKHLGGYISLLDYIDSGKTADDVPVPDKAYEHSIAIEDEAVRLGKKTRLIDAEGEGSKWYYVLPNDEMEAINSTSLEPLLGGDEVDNSVTGQLRREYGKAYMMEVETTIPEISKLWEEYHHEEDVTAISNKAGFDPLDSFAESFNAFTHPNYKPGTLPARMENFIDEVLSSDDPYDTELVDRIRERGEGRADRLKSLPEKYVTVESGDDEVVVSDSGEEVVDDPPEVDSKSRARRRVDDGEEEDGGTEDEGGTEDGGDGDDDTDGGDDFKVQLGFNTPFKDAMTWAKARTTTINPGSWKELSADAYSRAFSVAHVTSQQVLDDVREWSEKAHTEGLTFKKFQNELVPKLKERGWWATAGESAVVELEDGTLRKRLNMSRLGIIYDTNIAVANAVGRWQNIEENQDLWPYVQYEGIDDEMTRPTHRVLFGRVFRVGSEILDSIAPPNGFRCRCSLTQVDDDELFEILSETGFELDQLPSDAAPDEGWNHNPGKAGMLGGWEPEEDVPELPGKLKDDLSDLMDSLGDTDDTDVVAKTGDTDTELYLGDLVPDLDVDDLDLGDLVFDSEDGDDTDAVNLDDTDTVSLGDTDNVDVDTVTGSESDQSGLGGDDDVIETSPLVTPFIPHDWDDDFVTYEKTPDRPGVTETYYIETADGKSGLFKPRGNKGALQKDGLFASEREVATSAINDYLGFDVVPRTRMVKHPKHGVGSFQEWVKDGRLQGQEPTDNINPEDFYQAAIIEQLIDNRDRHSGNFLMTGAYDSSSGKTRLHLIDNGMSFLDRMGSILPPPYLVEDDYNIDDGKEFEKGLDDEYKRDLIAKVKAIKIDDYLSDLVDEEVYGPDADNAKTNVRDLFEKRKEVLIERIEAGAVIEESNPDRWSRYTR